MYNSNWTKEETILALALYYTIPPSKHDSHAQEVINLGNLLQRSPGSVAKKLANLKANDPTALGNGLKNCSHWDKELPNLYFDNPESLFDDRDRILHNMNLSNEKIDSIYQNTAHAIKDENENYFVNDYFSSNAKKRRKQSIFRHILLLNYNWKCCLSGIGVSDLLIASHIIPWSKDMNNRINPKNGLILNALLDKAFDCGYFTLDKNYTVRIASGIKDNQTRYYLSQYDGQRITLPMNPQCHPSLKALEYHNDQIFEKFKSVLDNIEKQ